MKNNLKTTVVLAGGLGNQLFQLAIGLHVTKDSRLVLDSSLAEHGAQFSHSPQIANFILPDRIDILDRRRHILMRKILLFLLKVSSKGWRKHRGLPLKLLRLFQFHAVKLSLNNGLGYDAKFDKILDDSNFLLGAFHTYVWASNPRVLSELREIRPSHSPDWLLELESCAAVEKPIVVHIRRGDFLKIKALGFLEKEYYDSSIKQMLMLMPKSRIWIFSDDIPFVVSHYSTGSWRDARIIDFNQEDAASNLEAMRLGHSYILSNSTFSWWGAFLSKNIGARVICPDIWLKGYENPKNFLPDHWNKVKAFE